MSDTGYYFLDYRAWWDKGFLWVSVGVDIAFPIAAEDVLQVVEMLIRASNDTRRTPEGRVKSTEEEPAHE